MFQQIDLPPLHASMYALVTCSNGSYRGRRIHLHFDSLLCALYGVDVCFLYLYLGKLLCLILLDRGI